jgi:alcohol dehydrogenase class IV
MTPAQGFTKGGVKRTLIDLRMIADTVIYDSEMTLDLPAEISAASAMNAIAHCVEGFYGALTTPLHALYAEEGIKALSAALPKIMATPQDIEARGKALYGAYMAGLAMLAGGGLHHHVAHMLGGSFNMSHSNAHAVALPHTANYNADAAPEALGRVARALGGESPSDAGTLLFDLGTRLGIDMNLKAHGFAQPDLDRAAVLCTDCHYPNPRKPKLADIREMLQNMYEGEKPLPGDRP